MYLVLVVLPVVFGPEALVAPRALEVMLFILVLLSIVLGSEADGALGARERIDVHIGVVEVLVTSSAADECPVALLAFPTVARGVAHVLVQVCSGQEFAITPGAFVFVPVVLVVLISLMLCESVLVVKGIVATLTDPGHGDLRGAEGRRL